MADPDDSAMHCGQCNGPEVDEKELIFCDGCQQYFHRSCQGLSEIVTLDDSWICTTCSRSTTSVEEITLEESAKAIAKELVIFKKKLEKQSQLSKMKMELENKKQELLWLEEKREVEMKISAQKKFNLKSNAERDNWKQRLMELAADQKQSKDMFDDFLKSFNKESSGKKRTKKKKRSKTAEKAVDCQQQEKSDSENDGGMEEFSESDAGDSLVSNPPKELTKAQLTTRQFHSWTLPIFTGKPDEWPIFISNYKTSTQACGFSNLENMMRLQDAVQGPAREIVSGQLIHPQEAPRVIETLQQLYGRPEQILDALLSKVRKAEAPKIDRLGTFITFGTIVGQLCAHIEATHLQSHLMNPLLISELVDKLPSSTKLEWVRYRKDKKEVNLRTLNNFLSELVLVASEVVNYFEYSLPNHSKGGKSKDSRSFVGIHDSEEKNTTEPKWPCPICGETNHRIRNCEEFKDMDVDERIEMVDEHNLCRLCLNSHGNIRCKMNIRCNVGNCLEKHNYLLHK